MAALLGSIGVFYGSAYVIVLPIVISITQGFTSIPKANHDSFDL